eukprot:m.225508 g.225508  ORF g.225508 m.225508 type:complete len:315 (+) comp15957_c4_seq13:1247-2191(+)
MTLRQLLVALGILLVALLYKWQVGLVSSPPSVLEPTKGVSQCNYELLRAFSKFVQHLGSEGYSLRYTLGAGTLLGAMRSQPPGLLKWEHDTDIYIPAKDAFTLVDGLNKYCTQTHSPVCHELWFRGFVERDGKTPCCGFGFKIYHRHKAICELDILVLGVSKAPYFHARNVFNPPWALLTTWPHWLASRYIYNGTFFVIPEDIHNKLIMSDASHWCNSTIKGKNELSWCGGPPVSFFQDEYLRIEELFPLKTVTMYNLVLNIPNNPWAVLNRTYGSTCSYIAYMNEHEGRTVDLRLPKHRHLREPANVTLSGHT